MLRFAWATAAVPTVAEQVRAALAAASLEVHSVFIGPFEGHRAANHFLHVFAEPEVLLAAVTVVSTQFNDHLLTHPAIVAFSALNACCYLCGGHHRFEACPHSRPSSTTEALTAALLQSMAALSDGTAPAALPAQRARPSARLNRARGDVARENNWCIQFVLGGQEGCARDRCRFQHPDENTIAAALEERRPTEQLSRAAPGLGLQEGDQAAPADIAAAARSHHVVEVGGAGADVPVAVKVAAAEKEPAAAEDRELKSAAGAADAAAAGNADDSSQKEDGRLSPLPSQLAGPPQVEEERSRSGVKRAADDNSFNGGGDEKTRKGSKGRLPGDYMARRTGEGTPEKDWQLQSSRRTRGSARKGSRTNAKRH